jgi:hypothetical protein
VVSGLKVKESKQPKQNNKATQEKQSATNKQQQNTGTNQQNGNQQQKPPQIEKPRKNKKRTIPFYKLWDELFVTKYKMNDSMIGISRRKNFYMDLKGIYSGEGNVTYMYTIDGMPSELEISFRNSLRQECKEGVRLSFITTFQRHNIQWNTPQMKSKLRTWAILDDQTEDVNEYNLHANLATLDSQQWRKDSLTYLSTAEIRRKRKMFQIRQVMLISGRRGENFNDTVKEVLATCKNMNLRVTRVMYNIQDYLDVFSPFSLGYSNQVMKDVGNIVVPDEIVARFSSYSQGTVGKAGIYWGTDIYSGFPCLKPVKRTTETAENWLITAETGGGKSYFVKGLLLQLLAKPEYNGTIMDIEGFEYIPFSVFLQRTEEVVVINMAEGQGKYFDPVEIIMTGDEELDKDMYKLSVSFTLSTFKTLLGDVTKKNEWTDIIIDTAVSKTYESAGVTEDMSTWKRSKGLTLYDVYKTLKGMLVDDSGSGLVAENNDSDMVVDNAIKNTEEYRKALVLAITKTGRYFEEGGTKADLFKSRVSVEGIKTAKLVICSFGMAGKTEKTVDPVQMALMQLCAANISHLRSIFSKHVGKFNFKLWEEFQRWGKFPDSEKTVGTALTGGRKLGDVNIIITNVVRELLDDDRFNVFSNVTTIAVGCIWDKDVRHDLCSRLTIEQMEPELDKLVSENKDESAYSDGDTVMNNAYDKAFLVGLDKTVYAISRMSIPAGISKSKLFRTGIDLQGTVQGEDS